MSSEDILNTIAKVKGLVPAEQMRAIESKSSQIAIDHTPWFGNKSLRLKLEEIKTAISENRLLSFDYSDRLSQKSQRIVEPYRLVLKDSNWYIQGYCTTRKDFRIFRLSRTSSLEILKETFLPREFNYKSQDFSFRTGREATTVKLLIDDSIRDLMVEFCGEENIESYGDNKFIAHCPFVEDEFWYNMLLRLGDKCEYLAPENVRSEVIRRIENLLAAYKKS
ncbi:Hypothetical protein LUCI_3026 [Lucifera butyrica]|uniref:Uncharacterized protein n=1 Tax=Lucifera butyrica TaxID=1351585 RepID=A0A498R8P3_9FIRM|nr:WYL domain-containing protein [Lucifera butyrica]VBB07761.1 Hypothetical protein LUCI_3026 [Lucifera butyrica]